MKKHYLYTFLCISIFELLGLNIQAQDTTYWSTGYSPRFRHVTGVDITTTGRLIAVGGWEFNDAITSSFYSDDNGSNWNIVQDNVNAWLLDVQMTSANTGYSVGYAGNIYKTTDAGENWNQLTVSGNAGSRNYNACYFFDDNTGIVIGGNESNDAIRTIIKTTDGGNNWSVIFDNLASWLRGVHFSSATRGYAVGDQGTVIKTSDGGENWHQLTLPGNTASRRYNDVHFIDDQTGIVVGGNPQNDSIQTILKTSDGGTSWSIVSDNIGSMLNAVHFYDNTHGYAVGDWGTILYTSDAGENWNKIEFSKVGTDDLYDVYFDNAYTGIIGGEVGKLLIYNDNSATAAIAQIESPITIEDTNTVIIKGIVNANGNTATVEFEYGTTMSFGTTVSMNPGSFEGSDDRNVNLLLSGLTEGEIYYGRIKVTNTFGSSYSDVVMFYTGVNRIPNWSFEFWEEFSEDQLNDWVNAGQLSQAASHDGSVAVKLNSGTGDEPGAILHGTPGDQGLTGGIPFTERPDSLIGWFNYNISVNDTAIILLQFKKDGALVADTIFKIAGTSNGNFERLAFKIDYSDPATPDTLLLAIANTNVFATGVDPNSELIIDNLSFIGSTQQIPNNDMEDWTTVTREKAISWVSRDDERAEEPFMVERSSDYYSGFYALRLANKTQGNEDFARIRTGMNPYDYQPEFPIDFRHENFYGNFQFSPNAGDTLFVELDMYNNGSQIGRAYGIIDTATTEYRQFAYEIQYWTQDIPDSCSISIRIEKDYGNGTPGDSYAIIDNLSFDGVISKAIDLSTEEIENVSLVDFNVFPNPTNGLVNIAVESYKQSQKGELILVDMTGKVLEKKQLNLLNTLNTLQLDLTNYSDQVYFIILRLDDKIYSKKVIKN